MTGNLAPCLPHVCQISALSRANLTLSLQGATPGEGLEKSTRPIFFFKSKTCGKTCCGRIPAASAIQKIGLHEPNRRPNVRTITNLMASTEKFFDGTFDGILVVNSVKCPAQQYLSVGIQVHLSPRTLQTSAKFAQKPLRDQRLRGFFTPVLPKFAN